MHISQRTIANTLTEAAHVCEVGNADAQLCLALWLVADALQSTDHRHDAARQAVLRVADVLINTGKAGSAQARALHDAAQSIQTTSEVSPA